MADLPPGVGPHEGREFDLIRRGEKHVAMFTDYEPDGLTELLSEGGYSAFTDWREIQGNIYPTLFVHRDSHKSEANRLCALTRTPPKGFDPDHERAVGQILGYTESEVDAFLAHVESKDR
jgi:hypothetical protein